MYYTHTLYMTIKNMYVCPCMCMYVCMYKLILEK